MTSVTLSEAKRLMRGWTRATFGTVARSIRHHFRKHGGGVEADNVWQYLRKAYGFRQNLRGAKRKQLPSGKVRYTKSALFLILDAQGKIVSYGAKNESND